MWEKSNKKSYAFTKEEGKISVWNRLAYLKQGLSVQLTLCSDVPLVELLCVCAIKLIVIKELDFV